MRTPNTTCLVCESPLYRRPSQLARVRYAACMKCRSKAQVVSGVTAAQHRGLSLGRVKGTNHRNGYSHRPESKAKASVSHKAFCVANPEKIAARGMKTREENHYRWKGGASKLNKSIRLMTENRRWMDAVKEQGQHKCARCCGTDKLESHHKINLSVLIERHGIKNRDDARATAKLWDIANGETLCERCHYAEHGRVYEN